MIIAKARLARAIRAMMLVATVLLIGSQTAFAATPEATVKEIVDKIKAAASPSPIIEYVDWEGAFSGIPEQQREMMKVGSSEEMKGLYRKILEDPIAAMRERMNEQLAQVPPDQKAAAQQQMQHMEQMISDQKVKMTEQIKATEYVIGDASVNGDNATVKLTQSYEGQKREEEIALVKKGDKWLLSSMDMFKPRPPAPPPGSADPHAGHGHGASPHGGMSPHGKMPTGEMPSGEMPSGETPGAPAGQ